MCCALRDSRLHDDFHILPESDEKSHQPFDRELAKVAAQHFSHVRLFHAEHGINLLQATAFHDMIDL